MAVEEGVKAEEGMQLLVNMNGFLQAKDGGKGDPLPAVAGGEAIPLALSPGELLPATVSFRYYRPLPLPLPR